MGSDGVKRLAKGLWRRLGIVGTVLILIWLILVIVYPTGSDVLFSKFESGNYNLDFTVSAKEKYDIKLTISHHFQYIGEGDFLIGVTITNPSGTVWTDNVLLEAPSGIYQETRWVESTPELELGNYTIYFTPPEAEGRVYRASMTQHFGPSTLKEAAQLFSLLCGFCFIVVAIMKRLTRGRWKKI